MGVESGKAVDNKVGLLKAAPAAGTTVGASVVEFPESAAGAAEAMTRAESRVGTMVGAAVTNVAGAWAAGFVGARCITRTDVGVGHAACSSNSDGTPDVHSPRDCPLSMKSAGSHNALPRSVQCPPPHHTHG